MRINALLRDLVDSRGCPSIVVVEISRYGLRREGLWWRLLGDYATWRDLPVIAGDLADLEHANGFLSGSTRGFERFYDYLFRLPEQKSIDLEVERHGGQYLERPWKFPRYNRDQELAPPSETLGRRALSPPAFELGASPQRGLEAIAAAVHGCAAELILLRMPSITTMSRRQIAHVDEDINAEIGAFADRHGAVFLDYNHVDLGLVTAQFRDRNHLNYEGAEVLSDHLARQVIAPRLDARR